MENRYDQNGSIDTFYIDTILYFFLSKGLTFVLYALKMRANKCIQGEKNKQQLQIQPYC